jgi:hypothetical protein
MKPVDGGPGVDVATFKQPDGAQFPNFVRIRFKAVEFGRNGVHPTFYLFFFGEFYGLLPGGLLASHRFGQRRVQQIATDQVLLVGIGFSEFVS